MQARNPDWVRKPFYAKFDPNAVWLDDLVPAFGEQKFGLLINHDHRLSHFDEVPVGDLAEERLLCRPYCSQSETLVNKLKEVGVPAKLVVKKGAVHGWAGMDKDTVTIADWFDQYLLKKGPPLA